MKNKMAPILTNIKTIGLAIAAIAVALIAQYGGSVQQAVNPETPVSLGALAGPDIPSPYLSWGGQNSWRGHLDMLQGTSTVCTFESPAATSTLKNLHATFNLASSTLDASVDFTRSPQGQTSSSTNRFGSDLRIKATQGGTFNATTTNESQVILPPYTQINVVMNDTLSGAGEDNAATGNCGVEFWQN